MFHLEFTFLYNMPSIKICCTFVEVSALGNYMFPFCMSGNRASSCTFVVLSFSESDFITGVWHGYS